MRPDAVGSKVWKTMRAEIKPFNPIEELETVERCFITEIANDAGDEALSVARARVEPGVTTEWHRLAGTAERYLIISGTGRVEVGNLPPTDVKTGDVVRIPPDTPQRITNTGKDDLIFFAVCTPRFRPECYKTVTAPNAPR